MPDLLQNSNLQTGLMLLRTKPEKAELSFTATGEHTSSVIILDCLPTDQTAVLEIGEGHVFASRSLRLRGKRRNCRLRVWIKRKSTLTPTNIEKINLSESKIGELGFCPPSKGGDFGRDSAGGLDAVLFVSDELHDRMMNLLEVGKKPTWLNLQIDKQGTLEYGWEPDGSRIIWKTDELAEPSFVDVIEVNIDFSFLT